MASRRLTQKDIATLAGVSQAAVSLILNNAASAEGRISPKTRARVNRVILETGYVADPIARRMAQGVNRILGVFTYEPAFPSAQADFFGPFLLGIEEAAQELGYDLLLLTGAAGGTDRQLLNENSRYRLADGCLLLGREFNRKELTALVAGDYPFVAIGRRDDAGGAVPYVGGDYRRATADLMAQAQALGHQRLAYVGPSSGPEATRDRWAGLLQTFGSADGLALHVPRDAIAADETLEQVLAARATAVFFTELSDAIKVEQAARARGLHVPSDLSIVVLGNHIRAEQTGIHFTSFAIPREAMGRAATQMLVRRIEGEDAVEQLLLNCAPVRGDTLGPSSLSNMRTEQ